MALQIYEIQNIQSARKNLSLTSEPVILSNPQGSTRYYGMRVIDYIFKTLQSELSFMHLHFSYDSDCMLHDSFSGLSRIAQTH